jgi:hypothetical protein
MLCQEKQSKGARLGRLQSRHRFPKEAGRSRVARHRPQRPPTFSRILLSKTWSSGAEAKKGDRRPTVPLNCPSPCLPTFSEPPCHTTSSSWKLPLGSALRMPNSISQGACQQPGLGFEEPSHCERRGPLATQLHHCPRRAPPSRYLLPEPGRRTPQRQVPRVTPPQPARAQRRRPRPSGLLRHASPSYPPSGQRPQSPPSSPAPTLRCQRAVLSPNYRCPGAGRVGRPRP